MRLNGSKFVLSAGTVVGIIWSVSGAAVAAPTGGEPACKVATLATPADASYSEVTGGDPTGRYHIGTAGISGAVGQRLLLWDRGVLQVLTPPGEYAAIADVNPFGVVVGHTVDTDGRTRGWRYRDGTFTLLPATKPVDNMHVTGINDFGDIVGLARDSSNPGSAPGRAVVWPASKPDTVREIAATTSATAVGIDDDGSVLGELWWSNGRNTGYRWPTSGSGHALVGPTTDWTMVTDIRLGWIVGWEHSATGAVPLRWGLWGARMDRLPIGFWPAAVNVFGTVAGRVGDTATLVRSGRSIGLPALSAGKAAEARVLADLHSRAAGAAYDDTYTRRAVVWSGC